MIVELAEMACRQLDELDTLQIAKNEANDINATLKELAGIKSAAIQVNELCSLLCDRLPLRGIQSVEIPKILKSVQDSHTKFTQDRERRQVVALRDIASRLEALVQKIDGLWKNSAENILKPYFELLGLVQFLPEVIEQEAILNGLKNRLEHRVSVPPRTQTELATFDDTLSQMRGRLTNLESLPLEVKTFLRKAQDHQATIADMTDEVIRWCRQGEHAKVFRIGFIH